MTKNAREVALKVLVEVNEEGAYSNISLNRNLRQGLNKVDENLTRELVYGVLENKLYLDWVISKFSNIKLAKIESLILEILRIGVYQIVFMEKIPDSAAVNESVKLAKKFSHRGSYGYVNGLLRNVSRKKDGIIEIDVNDKIEYLSIKYSHPVWLVKRWVKEYGYDFTQKLCEVNNTRSSLNIRVNTLKITREELKKILEDKGYIILETKYSFDGLIVKNPHKITETEEYKKGFFIVQDESSMLVAQIMSPIKNSFVLDLCSAPGGKATHIAQEMGDSGKIVARDIYEHKLKLVEENFQRLGIKNIETELFDSTNFDEKLAGKADYVLIDAPCTGLGMIRRRPEIKWNRKEEDIKSINDIQYKILSNGSKYVKPGGILIYSTCTIEKEENLELIKKFLVEDNKFELVGFDELLNSKEYLETAKDGYIELFPHIHNSDGFFIAKLLRNDR